MGGVVAITIIGLFELPNGVNLAKWRRSGQYGSRGKGKNGGASINAMTHITWHKDKRFTLDKHLL